MNWLGRVIKSNFVETQKTYIIGYQDIKDENRESTKSIESMNKNGDAINKVFKEEVEKKVRVEKLEQLKLKLQNETEEIKKSANEFSDKIIETANVRAREINDEMKIKAAEWLAAFVENPTPEKIIPSPFEDWIADAIARVVK